MRKISQIGKTTFRPILKYTILLLRLS